MLLLSGGAGLAAEVAVWELPRGEVPKPANIHRNGWKPARAGARSEGPIVVENGRLTVLICPGSTGLVVRSGEPDAQTETELCVRAAGASAENVADVKLVEGDEAGAVVRVVMGAAEAELAVLAGASHVTMQPLKGADSLEVRSRSRYAIVPEFLGDDKVFDGQAAVDGDLPVQIENTLLQLLEGGQAILLLTWGQKADGKPAEEKPDTKQPKPRAHLVSKGDGATRSFVAARIEFLGKPVHTALLLRKDIWHEEDVRSIPGTKTVSIGWKRPFDALWRADFVVEGPDTKDVAAFLRLAAQLGLSKDVEKDWEAAYRRSEGSRAASKGLWVESRDFRFAEVGAALPHYSPSGNEDETIPWPAVFRGDETLLTPPARWPCYPDPTEERLAAVQKERGAAGKEPLYPLHEYGRVLVFPIDRTKKTPLGVRTVIDILRETLGIGPCDLDWIERTR